jgi:ribosomal protein S6--L-glutamate ligase
MKNMFLVIGEADWPEEDDVVGLTLDQLTHTGIRVSPLGELQWHDLQGNWHYVHGVLWRSQFDIDVRVEHALLCMICSADTHCINSTQSIRLYGDRISLHAEMFRRGLPVLPCYYYYGINGYNYFHKPNYPCVIKMGNWHMGFGKMLVRTKESWSDATGMASTSNDFISIEPFVKYSRDLRVLIIGHDVIGIERIPAEWKANVSPKNIRITDVPDQLREVSLRISAMTGSQILGIDWIMDDDGNWVILEANMAPGLHGFCDIDLRPSAIQLVRDSVNAIRR